jgi:hypothetical protein
MSTTSKHTSFEFIRTNSEVFLGAPKTVDLRVFAGQLVSDAICLKCVPVSADLFNDWHVVWSDLDWLTSSPDQDPIELFYRLKRFPQLRANSHQSAVVVAAFSKDVFTALNGSITHICGMETADARIDSKHIVEMRPIGRVIGFRGKWTGP